VRFVSAALVLGACFLVPSVEAAQVRGQVFDASGEPIAGVKVAVVEVEGGGRGVFGGDETAPEELRVASDRTDQQGLFEIELGARSFSGDVFVRCVPGPGWDGLRYALPDPKEVTRELRRGEDVSATFRVDDAVGWRELKREIERVGGRDSKRGKILRKRGHPPEVLTTVDGREEWRYPGVTFVFEAGELVDIERRPAQVSDERSGGEGA
jgi:hypothetical protein